MTKIKICGLKRPEDIDFVNEARPDYVGFILEVPFSRRSISLAEAKALKKRLRPGIIPVGVFVDAPLSVIAEAVGEGIIEIIQLHGRESDQDVLRLRSRLSVPILKACRITGPEDVTRAVQSPADYLLFDHGSGGTGTAFDWSLVKDKTCRPFFLLCCL